MRKGWEYKRFEEVFDLQMGKTPDRKNPEYFGGNNVWVSIRDLGDKEIADSNEHITDFAVSNSNIRKVKRGTVIMSFKLTVGKCGIAATDLYTNEAIMAFNTKESFDINSSFLYYYLQCYHWVGSNKAVMGTTLNKATISKQYISIPPLSTQLAIVSELDKINELIRLKKEQLKDFDNLAQSLFYEMFGDPVENEKGWEVKKLREIGEVKTGNTPSRSNDNFYNEKFIEWIKTDNIRNEQMNPTTAAEYLSRDGAECGRIVSKGSILVACIAGSLSSIGKCCITTKNVAFNQQINAITPYGDFCNSIYLYELIRNSYKYIQQNATTGMKHILSKSIFEKMKFPLPPLPLQRLFAQRIEQIEREKSEVQKSIQDLETLLASRMQYWFE